MVYKKTRAKVIISHVCIMAICVSGCMNDVRFNGKWFPMLQEENVESSAADYMERSQNIEFGCESNMCGAGSGFSCPYELLCFDLWRHAECRSV